MSVICPILTKICVEKIFVKIANKKFNEDPPVGVAVTHADRKTDGQT